MELDLRLRPYQQAAIDAARAAFAHHRRVCLVLATGAGKTHIFAAAIRLGRERGTRALVVAERIELVDQAACKLQALGVEVEVEQGRRRASSGAPVVVACLPTLVKRLASYPRDAFDLVVVDECHHAPAAQYKAVLDHFASARVLGVTATPDRADGGSVLDVFDTIAYRYDIRDAIRDGYLVPPRVEVIQVERLSLDAVRSARGDLSREGLGAAIAQCTDDIAVPVIERCGTLSTLTFSPTVAAASALAQRLNELRPGCARAVSADTEGRTGILAAHRRGDFQFLCSCDLFLEGWDGPYLGALVVARPTKSRPLYTQMIGRGLRLLDGCASVYESAAAGKAECLVVDVTGVSKRHRLVHPIEALAGRELPVEVAERAAREGLRLDEIDDALLGYERQAAAANVQYVVEVIDPFLGSVLSTSRSSQPATQRQLEQIADAGIKLPNPEALDTAQADALLMRLFERARVGLASPKQCAWLRSQAAGIDKLPASQRAYKLRQLRLTDEDLVVMRAPHTLTKQSASAIMGRALAQLQR